MERGTEHSNNIKEQKNKIRKTGEGRGALASPGNAGRCSDNRPYNISKTRSKAIRGYPCVHGQG